MNYEAMFHQFHPDFFEEEGIRDLPAEYVFEEQILDLRTFDPSAVEVSCPEHITFGMYAGDLDTLRRAVVQVDEDWVQYFNEGDAVYCAFDGDQVVSFCNLDEFGIFAGQKIGGPGCVGTVPAYRKQGIGLKMVQNATMLLKEQGCDMSYIHYTHVGPWYAKLGYETVLRWNADGFVK